MSSNVPFKRSFRSHFLLLALVFILVATTTLVAAQPAAAEDNFIHVQGAIAQHFSTTNCNSPIGLCGVGTINGNKINGSIVGILNTLNYVYQNGVPVKAIFTGTFTITTSHGTMSGTEYVVQQIPGDFTQGVVTITSGTKRYKHTTGVLYVSGTPNPALPEEHYTYTGYLTKDADNGQD